MDGAFVKHAGVWLSVRRTEIVLECLDYGGTGTCALLLHGLAGTAHEWANTASWLTRTHRVLAPDQRGHGRSGHHPADLTRGAFVDDVVALIEELDLAPVTLIGQSLGGHTAFLVAARHPAIVRALVVAEASPAPTAQETAADVRDWLRSWPAPFASREAAWAFFGGDSVRARAWASGLEERDGGWWPSFDAQVMHAALEATVGRSYWDEWERIEAPTLIVRAEAGELGEVEAAEMAARIAVAEVVEIADVGHDLHLEAPVAWRNAVGGFLDSLGP